MPSTQEQRHSLKGVSRRVFVLLLLPLLVSLAGMGAYLSRRITQLEAAVWEHSEFAGLERSESLMQALVSSQIIPGFLRHRASGLLGDLAYHRKDSKTALAYYGQSMGRHKGSDFSNLLQFVPSALQSPGDFHRGFRDHSASPPRQLPLNDADLELVPPSKSGDAEAWRDLTAIPPVDAGDTRDLWEWIQSAKQGAPVRERADEWLAKYQAQIIKLRQFTEPVTAPDPDDFSAMSNLSGFAGLMMLDVLQQAGRGNWEDAGRSFDAAYALLGCFERNPRLVTLLLVVSRRSQFADLLESKTGDSLRGFFRQRHCLKEAVWVQFPMGEYQATKRLTAQTMPTTDPSADRLRGRVLAKQAAFWRGIPQQAAGNPLTDISDIMSGCLFKNRRFFQQADSASYADGRRVAEEFEDCIAEIVHRVSVPNMGSIGENFAKLRTRETVLARPQAE